MNHVQDPGWKVLCDDLEKTTGKALFECTHCLQCLYYHYHLTFEIRGEHSIQIFIHHAQHENHFLGLQNKIQDLKIAEKIQHLLFAILCEFYFSLVKFSSWWFRKKPRKCTLWMCYLQCLYNHIIWSPLMYVWNKSGYPV